MKEEEFNAKLSDGQKRFYDEVGEQPLNYLDRLNIIYINYSLLKEYIKFLETNKKQIDNSYTLLNDSIKRGSAITYNLYHYMFLEIGAYYDLCIKKLNLKKETINHFEDLWKLRHLVAHTDWQNEYKTKKSLMKITLQVILNKDEIIANFEKFHQKMIPTIDDSKNQ